MGAQYYSDNIDYYLQSNNPFLYSPAVSVIVINKHVRRLTSNAFAAAVINALEINKYKAGDYNGLTKQTTG